MKVVKTAHLITLLSKKIGERLVSASNTILLDIRVQMGQNTSLSKNVNVDAEYAQNRDKNIAELKNKLKTQSRLHSQQELDWTVILVAWTYA